MLYNTHYKYGRDALMLFHFYIAYQCHPERSEGSGSTGGEMLRYAQHDKPAISIKGCI